jgi:hypothetical protein
MKLDFDSGKKLHNYVKEYADIYSQFDKDALAKEQLKIDQQKVGMLQQQFATEQAANVSKLKAQGMLADNPDISAGELASVDIGLASKLQDIRYSEGRIKEFGKPKERTEAYYKRALAGVAAQNDKHLKATVGKEFLDNHINSFLGDETTGSLWWKSDLAEDVDTSSLSSVISFYDKNKSKLGMADARFKAFIKATREDYKQALSNGAMSIMYGGGSTASAPPSGGQGRNVVPSSVLTAGTQAPLNPVGTPNQQPSVSQALIRIQAAIDETNTLEELAQLQQTVSEKQKAVQVTPQQAAEVNAKFDKKSRELGR